jgi:hypothetical protein
MLTALLVTALAQLPTPFDFIDNAEIGDATQSISLRSQGTYEGQATDAKKAKSDVTGKWKMTGDALEVKATGCKGPACKELKRDFAAKVTVVAPRAMVIASTAPKPFLQSGSYYCRFLGCEQRVGIEVVSKAAKLRLMHVIEDHLIEKNRGRDATVVWLGARPDGETPTTKVELCGRDPERAKKGLELLKADLADLTWVGELAVDETPKSDCLWDVRLVIKDSVALPKK